MKKTVLVLFMVVSVIFSARAWGENLLGAAAYDPILTYTGMFEKDRLYKMRDDSEFWRGNIKPAKIFLVKCPDAAHNLGTKGVWTGNLRQDGACGPKAEPAQWATGNYLNFSVPAAAE